MYSKGHNSLRFCEHNQQHIERVMNDCNKTELIQVKPTWRENNAKMSKITNCLIHKYNQFSVQLLHKNKNM